MIANRLSVPARSAGEVVRLGGSRDGFQKPYIRGGARLRLPDRSAEWWSNGGGPPPHLSPCRPTA